MDAKKATRIARDYITAAFVDEDITQLELEEVVHGPDAGQWRITFGFARPWDKQRALDLLMGVKAPRVHKVVTVADDGQVISLTDSSTLEKGKQHTPIQNARKSEGSHEKKRTANSGFWSTIWKSATGAIETWVTMLLVAFCVAAFLLAAISYAEEEFAVAIIIAAVLSLVITVVQISGRCLAQPTALHWPTKIRKVLKELSIGIAMHYPAMLGGIYMLALLSLKNNTGNGISEFHITMVLVHQLVLTGAASIMFRERLRKRIPPPSSPHIPNQSG